jgi:hypothetical protein
MEFCGEIQYMGEYYDVATKKMEIGGIHSDICHHPDGALDEEYRQFLHNCLDEWLDKGNCTGFFWVGNPEDIVKEFRDE